MFYFLRLAIVYFLLLPCSSVRVFAQEKKETFLEEVLRNNNDPVVKKVIADPSAYRLQLIYTRIDRDGNNRPAFTNFYYGDTAAYFNPASMVKLPLAILALEKLNLLNKPGVNKYTH